MKPRSFAVSAVSPLPLALLAVACGGLDFLRSRERSWGFEARLASFAGNVTTMSLGVRGTLRWGFF